MSDPIILRTSSAPLLGALLALDCDLDFMILRARVAASPGEVPGQAQPAIEEELQPVF